ncbi:MAG: PAN domain-containing protein [Longimicrobiales bacterium]
MRTVRSLAAVVVIAVTAAPTHAQTRMIDRSCDATLLVHIVGEEGGGVLFTFNPAIPDIAPPYKFGCQGTCGALVPNRCRRRASEVGFKCMRALAGNPESGSNFEEECPSWSLGLPASNVQGMLDFRMRERPLAAYFRNYVCAAANGWYDSHTPAREHDAVIRYEILGRTWGDTGCGGGDDKRKTETLAMHTMTCERERGATSDVVFQNTLVYRSWEGSRLFDIEYKGFELPQPDVQLCRSACMNDSRCMAWQYSVDFYKHPGPYCKLMDRYPQRTLAEGVVSGMK